MGWERTAQHLSGTVRRGCAPPPTSTCCYDAAFIDTQSYRSTEVGKDTDLGPRVDDGGCG